MAEFHDEFEQLLKKGILDKKSILPSFFSDVVKESFVVPDHITEAIIKNQQVTNAKKPEVKSIYGVFKTLMAFFGESEKNVNKIFNDYRSFSDTCKKHPILLFNEADALISKRHSNSHSTMTNVENAIQNILLEALENFNGIFFATTNMIRNFDSAFARRFLYKIEFQPPELPIKEKIWQSKIDHLTKDESIKIVRKYTLTGGQIDNDEELRIKMKLYITHDLKMELLSFGENVEMIKPESLRKGMMQSLEQAINKYH